MLRSIGIYGQTKSSKRLPVNWESLDKDSVINMLAGLYDTDGSVFYNNTSSITLTQSNKEILIQVQTLLRKLGILSHIYKINPIIKEGRKDKNPWFTLQIKDKKSIYHFCNTIPLRVDYKKEAMEKMILQGDGSDFYKYQYDNIRLERVKSIESIGIQRIYNLTANDSHTYLANNIITHNTGEVRARISMVFFRCYIIQRVITSMHCLIYMIRTLMVKVTQYSSLEHT